MELTTFTTAQIYSIFAALSCAAVAGCIFYCIGLRTGKAAGYELGHNVAKNYWKKIVCNTRSTLGETRDLLDSLTREAMTLRNNIKAEAEDHAKVERGLLNRLAAAAPLSDEDHAVLVAASSKLELAAGTFAGLGSHDHARCSRHLQAQVLDMAERIKKAHANAQPHPDSELIEWLDLNAVTGINPDEGLATITFNAYGSQLPEHLRTLLRMAKADSDDIDQHGAEALRRSVQEKAA